MRKQIILLLFCLCAILSAGSMQVFVSIPPMLEAVHAIGGAQVSVRRLLPAGSSPETYQPDARTLSMIGHSQVFFTIGVPFEKVLLPKLTAAFPRLKVVDGTAGMKRRKFEDGGEDPHVWLSSANMLLFAENVARTLSELAPEHAEEFSARLEKYRASVQAVEKRILSRLAPLRGKDLLVYHPAFGYFLEEQGIRQIAVEAAGKEPTGAALQEMTKHAREMNAPAIFVQPQFSSRSAQILSRELHCQVVKLDPLPVKWTAGMEELAEAIAKAYSLEKVSVQE